MNHEQYHEYELFVQQFESIISNLWYTWDPEAQKLVDVLLNKTNHELSSFQRFKDLSEENKQELFANSHLRASVDHVYRKLQDYLSNTTWFDTLLEKYPEYDVFIQHSDFTSGVLRANIKRRLVFFSSNDPIVPVPLTFKFSHLLNAQLIEVAEARHFRMEDGYSTFPQLLQILQTLVKAELS